MPKNRTETKDIFINYIKNNQKEFVSVIILFFIGLILGVLCINNTSEIQKTEITNYVQNFITELKENANIDRLSLIKSSIQKNFITTILLWFVGLAVISIPLVYLFIAFRGFCLGYTIASIVATLGNWDGILFVASGILAQNIIFIPCLLALGVSGIKLYKCIKQKNGNIKAEICRHTFFSLFIFLLLIVTSFIETYVSSQLLVQYIKYL